MLHRENKITHYHESSAADLIKETMEYHGITQADLASRIGVSQKYVSDIVNRKQYLNEEVALRIESVTGISAKLLLGLDTSYKLEHAKQEAKKNSKAPLRRYSWA